MQATKEAETMATKKSEETTEQQLDLDVSMIDDMAIATDLLITSKAAVRNLAVAITETATPAVKRILRRELDNAIDTHDKIAQYMIKNEMYHAYDLQEQMEHDIEKADIALNVAKK